MKRIFFLVLTISFTKLFAQSSQVPAWFLNTYKQLKLDEKYKIDSYIKPGYLLADFNGDGIIDIAVLMVEKRTNKKGLLILLGKSNQYFVFGAGKKLGNVGDESDDLKWMNSWKVYNKKIAYETKFKDGDMVGSIKRKLTNKGIVIWSLEDGAPMAGGIIYWNGKVWNWIHQGE